ncbi:protein kinase domain-containing protein [Schumannella soli]|uniref:non-specific serine/threonine protein kinase n=1 Tax=Schumannella soli TaxID=2590779 RepID=A0A506Y402_9MICO|nr:NINE protein [Schumannella soli]TPW75738.1 NINE protein [Schumannella soli]
MPSRPRPAMPARIAGWRLGQKLGEGAFGYVVEASRLRVDGTRVEAAMKVMQQDPDMVLDLAHEFKVMKGIDSPYVVKVLDSGIEENDDDTALLWIATELVRGQDLRDEVRRGGPLARDEWWTLAHDLLSALDATHQVGLVHLDVKPANVMRQPGRSVLVDFGIASFVAVSDPGDVGGGTPGYCSPEQVDGRIDGADLHYAADLFAAACTLTFAGIGRSPWRVPKVSARELGAALHRTLTTDPPYLTGLDAQQVQLLTPMLSVDPSKRPSAEQALEFVAEQREAHRRAAFGSAATNLGGHPAFPAQPGGGAPGSVLQGAPSAPGTPSAPGPASGPASVGSFAPGSLQPGSHQPGSLQSGSFSSHSGDAPSNGPGSQQPGSLQPGSLQPGSFSSNPALGSSADSFGAPAQHPSGFGFGGAGSSGTGSGTGSGLGAPGAPSAGGPDGGNPGTNGPDSHGSWTNGPGANTPRTDGPTASPGAGNPGSDRPGTGGFGTGGSGSGFVTPGDARSVAGWNAAPASLPPVVSAPLLGTPGAPVPPPAGFAPPQPVAPGAAAPMNTATQHPATFVGGSLAGPVASPGLRPAPVSPPASTPSEFDGGDATIHRFTSAPPPAATFDPAAGSAVDPAGAPRSFFAVWLLSWLLGVVGADRFYVGRPVTGVLKLITAGGIGVWAIMDLILLSWDVLSDGQGRRLVAPESSRGMLRAISLISGVLWAIFILLLALTTIPTS